MSSAFARRLGLASDAPAARVAVMLASLVAIGLGLDLATGGLFLSPRNLYNLAVQASAVGVMACGMVLVIVARHIDLSVGSVLGFTGMAMAYLQVEGLPAGGSWGASWGWPASVAAGMLLGAAIGAWNGYWVAYRGLPAFVVTLAGLLIFRGGAWLLTEGRTLAPLASGYARLGGGLGGAIGATASWLLALLAVAILATRVLRGRVNRRADGVPLRPLWQDAAKLLLGALAIGGFVLVMNSAVRPGTDIPRGIPVPVLILVATALGMTGVARMTRFGRHVFALGGSPEAAERAGIDVRRVTLGVFTLMGALAAVAAVITTARLDAGTNSMGTLAELHVIAAAVLGGTSLAGGAGSVAGAVLGALVMQSLDNGMLLLGVTSALRQVLIGAVLIAAVSIDAAVQRRPRR